MATDFPELYIRDHSDLADALRAVQNHLGLSNESLEALAGLTAGHADKMLGPSRTKGIGPRTFALLLGALGIRLKVEIDLEQMARMERRFEKRNDAQVRERLSKAVIERARPYVLAELGYLGEPNGHINVCNGCKG
jgi:hypothetical protein